MNCAKSILLLIGAALAMDGRADIVANLLLDPGFEAITGNEPNAATSPWFTTDEAAALSFVSTTTQKHSGNQSALFNYYYDKGGIAQTLGIQIEAGKNYEMSVWMRIDTPSANAAHTNAATLNLTLATSTTVDGTYGYKIAEFGNIPTVVGEWQQFSRVFTASQLSTWVGEYMQVRLVKHNENTTHKIYIDDASFVVIPEPATLGLVAMVGVGLLAVRRFMI